MSGSLYARALLTRRQPEVERQGVPGIRYYDAGSRAAGEGSHNYVVFDDATLNILRKYGIAGLGLDGAAAAGGSQDASQ